MCVLFFFRSLLLLLVISAEQNNGLHGRIVTVAFKALASQRGARKIVWMGSVRSRTTRSQQWVFQPLSCLFHSLSCCLIFRCVFIVTRYSSGTREAKSTLVRMRCCLLLYRFLEVVLFLACVLCPRVVVASFLSARAALFCFVFFATQNMLVS